MVKSKRYENFQCTNLTHVHFKIYTGGKRTKGSSFLTVSTLYKVKIPLSVIAYF